MSSARALTMRSLYRGCAADSRDARKPRAEHRAVRPQREHRGQAPAVRQAARREHRQVADRVAHLRHQHQRRDQSTHVPPGLDALRDDHVGAGALGVGRLFCGAALPDDFLARVLETRNVLGRRAPKERHRVDRSRRDGLREARPEKRNQLIAGERLFGQPTRGSKLVMNSLGSEADQTHRAHPTGLGDRAGQLGHRDRAHPGQHDRQFDTEQLAEPGFPHVARASF